MLCDICTKNPATVHLTEIIDGAMNELHLCEECARKKSAQMESQFGLSDLLAGISDFGKLNPKETETLGAVKCPSCGVSFADFKKVGRLGCSQCYVSFKKYLGPLLKRIHGSNQHIGKSPFKLPKAAEKKADLRYLRDRLQRAIEDEAFEEAAKLRDQIKELEKKQLDKNSGKKDKNETK